jgi:threonine dehydrogenase-like Zn-dependent dehydrogenase
VLTRRSIIGSFSQTYCFPRAIDLLDSGKIRTKGMVWVQGDWGGMGKLNTDV